jgi:hypothetical protein
MTTIIAGEVLCWLKSHAWGPVEACSSLECRRAEHSGLLQADRNRKGAQVVSVHAGSTWQRGLPFKQLYGRVYTTAYIQVVANVPCLGPGPGPGPAPLNPLLVLFRYRFCPLARSS